jgi:glycosyltransferase involved in cell wall biosynthesis
MSETKKLRIFFLTYYPPTPTMGGAMAFYRHFVEREDFELFVATTEKKLSEHNPSYPYLLFDRPKWSERLVRTRFGKWIHSLRHLFGGYFIPRNVLRAAQTFQPDCIFTIAGSWDYTAPMSLRLARKLNVPLATSFNDWYDYSKIMHPLFKKAIERRYRELYRNSDLALCTSEGMREALGEHPNAHILYPIGSIIADISPVVQEKRSLDTPFIIAFAGSLADWYGAMLEHLVITAQIMSESFEFRFYGGNPSWSAEFDAMARKDGIFRGLLPFSELRDQMDKVDLLILPMGFGEKCAQVEKTSFKTKFLDYLTYKKPILVWGPDYCSAVRVAREFDSGEVCTDPDPRSIIAKISSLSGSKLRQKQLVDNAQRMYEDRFHPDKIHSALLGKIDETIRSFRNPNGKG